MVNQPILYFKFEKICFIEENGCQSIYLFPVSALFLLVAITRPSHGLLNLPGLRWDRGLLTCFRSRYYSSLCDHIVFQPSARCSSEFENNMIIQYKRRCQYIFCMPISSLILSFCIFFTIAAFRGDSNDTLSFHYQSVSCCTNYLETDKVFELEFFVCCSWIVFLVNAHTSGIHDATRFLESTLEFMRDVSFRYLRIILSILLINFMIYSPE